MLQIFKAQIYSIDSTINVCMHERIIILKEMVYIIVNAIHKSKHHALKQISSSKLGNY